MDCRLLELRCGLHTLIISLTALQVDSCCCSCGGDIHRFLMVLLLLMMVKMMMMLVRMLGRSGTADGIEEKIDVILARAQHRG